MLEREGYLISKLIGGRRCYAQQASEVEDGTQAPPIATHLLQRLSAGDELTVSQLAFELDASVQLIRYHLKSLEKQVQSRRDGQTERRRQQWQVGGGDFAQCDQGAVGPDVLAKRRHRGRTAREVLGRYSTILVASTP